MTNSRFGIRKAFFAIAFLIGSLQSTAFAVINCTDPADQSIYISSPANNAAFPTGTTSVAVTFTYDGTVAYSGATWSLTSSTGGNQSGSIASTTQSLSLTSLSGASYSLTITPKKTGTCSGTITAGTVAFSIASGAPQAITGFSPATPINYSAGATFPLSATGGASSNPVVFGSLTPGVCTVSGSTASIVSAGICNLTANQAGNASYSPAPQVRANVTITQLSQSINFPALGDRTFGDAPFGVGATATSGLAVSFSSTTTAVCTVSASTVTMVTSGTCTIAADQAGNGAYAAAPTVLQSFTVLQPGQINTGLNAAISVALALLDDDGIKANQSITFTQPPDKTFGDAAFGINATSTSGLPISFSSSTASVCSIAGSTVTILGAGLCTITAGQAGDANFNAAPPVARSFTVRKADQTIAFCAGTPKVYGDAPLTVSAIAASGLAVSLTPTTTSVCSVSGSTVSLLSSGTCSITANQAGNANYNAAAPVGQSFTVYPTGQTIPPSIPALTATTSTTNINLGSSVTISGNLSGSNSPLNISLNANNVNAGSISCTTGAYSLSSTPTKAGVYTYAVVATDPATGQTVVTAKTKVVVAEVPAATPLGLPATTSTAGATAGSFAVNGIGAAPYSVPNAIPS